MRFAFALLFAIALYIPSIASATPPTSIEVATDGFPQGQGTPEGVASDFARAFIGSDAVGFRRLCIRVYSKGESRAQYKAFLSEVVAGIEEEGRRATPSTGGPAAIGKVFAARRLTSNGPASYGYAAFGFQDVAFVDVGVVLRSGEAALNRTFVVKDRDGKWYVHPAPHLSPLLSDGLNSESSPTKDFSDAYRGRNGK